VLWPGPGWALFCLAVLIPAVVLVVRSVQLGGSAGVSFWPSVRQWTLLGRTAWLAACGVLACLVLSLPAAYVVGRLGRTSRGPLIGALLLAPLLLPPMVYAFGWQRTGLSLLQGRPGCVWVWASWCWPIPALLMGSGWARGGRASYAAALLDASPPGAFIRVVVPLLARQAAVAGLILLVLFLGEYSVPHACGLTVLATELLGWAANSDRPADVLLPALPLAATALVGLVVLHRVWRRAAWEESAADGLPGPPVGTGRLVALMLLVDAGTVALPIGLLTAEAGSWSAMAGALRTYGGELAASLAVSAATGLLAVGMGLSLVGGRGLRGLALVAAVLWGVLPGALVGEAILTAYQRFPILYDHWPLLVIGYLARFAWIGIGVAWLAAVSLDRGMAEQARTDGAGEGAILRRLALVPQAPLLLCGVATVAALSLADLAVASLVQVPSVGLVSLKLIESFHRFEDGMLVSLSLWLVAAAAPAALLAWVALRARRGGIG